MDAYVVGCRILREANGLNITPSEQKRFANAMHSIHDAAIRGEDDRKSKVTGEHQLSVLDDIATSQRLGSFVGPIGFVDFTNLPQRDALPRQVLCEFDEPIDIPGAQPFR